MSHFSKYEVYYQGWYQEDGLTVSTPPPYTYEFDTLEDALAFYREKDNPNSTVALNGIKYDRTPILP